MNEPLPIGLLFVYLVSIALSLVGGLLLGYFAGRTRNGQAEDLIELQAKFNVLIADLEGLRADMVVIKSLTEVKDKARLDVEPPAANPEVQP